MFSPTNSEDAVDTAPPPTDERGTRNTQIHGPPVLEVEGLSVVRSSALVLKDVTFTIHRSDYVGIVGPNGGGKTTLILSILGLLPRAKGTIRLFGQPIEDFTEWEKIAYVSQDAINFDSQFPLNVRELVGLGRTGRHNIGRRLSVHDWDAVDEALHFVGLSETASKRIGQLSGGQKQRMFVAKALVGEPDMLFLDEPATGIDASAMEAFYHRLGLLNRKKGTTILITSHDLGAVFYRMSEIMCVNREVNVAPISDDPEMEKILRKAYGEHFHFVLHGRRLRGGTDSG